jgi:hypothetical protein
VDLVSAAEGTFRVNVPASATADFVRDMKLVWDFKIEDEDGFARTFPDADFHGQTLGYLLVRMAVG